MRLNCNHGNIKIVDIKSSDPLCDENNAGQHFMSICNGRSACSINNNDLQCPTDIDLTYVCVDDVDKNLFGQEIAKLPIDDSIWLQLDNSTSTKKDNVALERQSKMIFPNLTMSNIRKYFKRNRKEGMENVNDLPREEIIQETSEQVPESKPIFMLNNIFEIWNNIWSEHKDWLMVSISVNTLVFLILIIFYAAIKSKIN